MHQLDLIGNQCRSPYKFIHHHNLISISVSGYLNYKEVLQLINDNNYVNPHDVTNLGLKFILVTQKQVLKLYITVIECKTLYGLPIPHTAFPKATKETTTEVHVTKDRDIGTSHS